MLFNNKIVRFINQNRKTIILIISIIIFVLLIIKALNIASANRNVSTSNNTNNISKEIENSKQTIISDTKIDDEEAESNYNLIIKFTNYCNENNIQEAYNLLTNECKSNVYPTIESFKENYVQVVFQSKQQVDVQSWIEDGKNYTYLVKYVGDILSTGDYSNTKKYEDYITIDSEQQKLNINRYIGRTEINQIQEVENIKFTINYVDVYKDYEEYSLKIENLNSNEIILDNLSSTTNTYIETNKETKINCSNYEAGKNSFIYKSGVSKTVKLKFVRQYNLNIEDKKIVFSSAILDMDNQNNTKIISINL